MESKSTIFIGCLVGIVSSATQSLGITLQRKSHLIEETKPRHLPYRPVYKRSLWRLGFSLFLMANIFGSTVQITTLPLIILSPLQAIGLVFNSICASIVLNEFFTNNMILGTILVSFGALVIAFFGSVPEPTHSLLELIELMKRKAFLAWFSFTLSMVLLLLLWIYLSRNHFHVLKSSSFEDSYLYQSIDDTVNNEDDASEDQGYDGTRKHHLKMLQKLYFFLFSMNHNLAILIQGVFYGIICGILSAHSLLLAKSAVELVTRSIIMKNFQDLKNIQTWIIVSMFLTIALTQVYFLNCGLRNCSTSILYPLIFCIYNIINIFNGLIYFNQLNSLTQLQAIMIFVGTTLVLLGVLALSWNTICSDNSITYNFTQNYYNSSQTDSKSLVSESTSLLSSSSILPKSPDKPKFNNIGTPINKKSKKSYFLNNEESNIVYVGNTDDESQYVSFGSPRNSPIIMQDTSLNEDIAPTNNLDQISPFRYSSLNYDLEHGDKLNGKRSFNNRRVLSFEQNELLSQLKVGSERE